MHDKTSKARVAFAQSPPLSAKPMQKILTLSPCGTSVLTNGLNMEQRNIITRHANTKHKDSIPQEDRNQLESLLLQASEKLNKATPSGAARYSAELNGILRLNRMSPPRPRDHHILVCTDTWLGEAAAKIVEAWLTQQGSIAEVRRQNDLRTDDSTAFRMAISDMVRWCDDVLPQYKSSGYHVVFNLTGGFKSVQGFLQVLACFYADETIYIFEQADDLLRIPRLPVEMTGDSTLMQHLGTFRRIGASLPIQSTAGVPEIYLLEIEDHIDFSSWGELVWRKAKPRIYQSSLLDSPSHKIRYGPKFKASAANLSPDRLSQVNERMDQLAKHLESIAGSSPDSLDFKPLKGNPRPPSTHEIDAWNGSGAKRMFGHFKDNGRVFVLDVLGDHL